MKLYFTNDSKQQKRIVESDYVEDLYDEIIMFFEDHHKFPHFLEASIEDEVIKVIFGSSSEYFYIDTNDESVYLEFTELLGESLKK